ncbi:MAG: hypothetical protein M3Y79_00985 [Pseudomonadota bacterium]|nr:hypothetical protein [Pseudomonadota bacterium]
MDVTFIQQNQIIERYLMGKLPLKGAQDFERWCRENPDTVAQLGLSDRINSALRLLDAAGEPLPWTEKPLAPWQRVPAVAAIAAVAVVGVIAAAMLFSSVQKRNGEIVRLQRAVAEQPLHALQGTRPLTMELSRTGPVNRSMATIGGSRAELADFKFDVSWSKYSLYIVTIDRVDQGRVAVVSNLARDSNGHLKLGINTSALGPGDYTVQVEGLDLRRGTEPQGWTRFSVTR